MTALPFPTGLAEGKAFCNRVDETERLLKNIEKGKHTLLVSPRRYGKSSLARHAIRLAKVAFAEIDLFVAIDTQSVETQILKGIKQLIQQVSDTPEQWFSSLRNFFDKAGKKWTIGVKGLYIELTPEKNSHIASNILDALEALEDILATKKQKAVFFIDEFQEIGELAEAKALEGSIRHFAQESKYLTFIFSGSNQHMLMNLFNNRSRPLYLLCDRIKLDRIAKNHYEKHFRDFAKKNWNAALTEDAFNKIMEMTECHPFFVNVLCDRLWSNCKNLPTASEVEKSWMSYVYEEHTEIRKEITGLGVGQLKVLIAIAFGENRELTRSEIQLNLKLTSSAIVHALKTLEERDYIEKLPDNSYQIINPVIKASLKIYYQDYLQF